MENKIINITEWKERHPRLFAIVKVTGQNQGNVILESNRRNSIARNYEENYADNSEYVFIEPEK